MQNRSNFEVLRKLRFTFKLIFHFNFIGNPYFFFLTRLVMFLCNSIHSSVNKTQFDVSKSKFVTGRPTKLVSPSLQKLEKNRKNWKFPKITKNHFCVCVTLLQTCLISFWAFKIIICRNK